MTFGFLHHSARFTFGHVATLKSMLLLLLIRCDTLISCRKTNQPGITADDVLKRVLTVREWIPDPTLDCLCDLPATFLSLRFAGFRTRFSCMTPSEGRNRYLKTSQAISSLGIPFPARLRIGYVKISSFFALADLCVFVNPMCPSHLDGPQS